MPHDSQTIESRDFYITSQMRNGFKQFSHDKIEHIESMVPSLMLPREA